MKHIILCTLFQFLVSCGGYLGVGVKKTSVTEADSEDIYIGPKRVFVTSTASDGDFGGIDAADTACNALASAANLKGGSWVAFLSDTTIDAKDRLRATGPWYLIDETTLTINDMTELTSGSITHAIDMDENGNTVTADVWTGTIFDGTKESNGVCDDWTNGTGSGQGRHGRSDGAGGTWTHYTVVTCDFSKHIYCFEQD